MTSSPGRAGNDVLRRVAAVGGFLLTGGFAAVLVLACAVFGALAGPESGRAALTTALGGLVGLSAIGLLGWLLYRRGRRYVPAGLWAGAALASIVTAGVLTNTLTFSSLVV